MISGDSSLSKHLIKNLEKNNFNVKLILPEEADHEKWASDVDATLILKGKASDSRLLLEENIEKVDSFVAIGTSDEQNIMTAILSKQLGAKYSVALVNNRKYLTLAHTIGVDAAVNSEVAAALAIIRFIYSEAILSASDLLHTEATMIEVEVQDDHELNGKTIKDIHLPYGILISAIIRDSEAIIPSGNDQILPGDRLVIFFVKSAVKKLEKLLGISLKLLKS